MKTDLIIKSTKDYSIFKLIEGNRTIYPSHVRKLSEAIAQRNLMAINPIVVNDKMEVVDGQHRLQVAKDSGLEVYYIIAKDTDLSDVQTINANNRSWSPQDYIDSYVIRGFKDYVVLDDFIKLYGFPPIISMMLLLGGEKNNSKFGMKGLSQGTFKVSDVRLADIMAKRLLELQPYTEFPPMIRNRMFISALFQTYKIVKPQKFLYKVSIYPQAITKEPTAKDYLRQFEEIYNWHSVTAPVRFF